MIPASHQEKLKFSTIFNTERGRSGAGEERSDGRVPTKWVAAPGEARRSGSIHRDIQDKQDGPEFDLFRTAIL
jgi:hypothetical protein